MGFDQSTANRYDAQAGVNQQAFDPMQNQQFAAATGNATSQAAANQAAMNNQAMTTQFNVGSQAGPYQVQAPQQVSYNGVTPSLNRADSGIQGANLNLGNVQDSRAMQVANLSPLQAMAAGQGPSVGRSAMDAGAAQATGAYGSAAEQAARAYGQQGLQANAAYGDAAAQQQFATLQAGQQAAQQFQDANQAGLQSQAALAAGARGGNIGLALRGGMQNAAGMSQRANIESGRAMQQAAQNAGFQAAQAQRAAALNQGQAALQTAGMNEQARLQALRANEVAAAQGAGLQAQEAIAAQGQLGQQLGQIRAQDLGAVGAATGVGQLGLGADTLQANTLQQNAQGALQAAGMNQQAGLQTQQMGLSAYEQAEARDIAAQQGNQSVAAQMAGLYGNLGQGYANQANSLATTGLQTGIQGEQLRLQDLQAAQDRSLNAGLGVGAAQTQLLGAGLSGVGALGAAALSDRRAKEDISRVKAPDFRGVGSHRYRYKTQYQDDANPAGYHVGPMADELPSTVKRRGPDGLEAVDTGRLSLHNTSAIGDAQRRISDLEDIISRLGGKA